MSIRPFSKKIEDFKSLSSVRKSSLDYKKNELMIYGKSDFYEVPLQEIPIWIENGWKFDDVQNKMYKKGRESVNVQQSKVN